MNLLKNFLYETGVEYDTEMYHECDNGSDCCKDDYCRCGVITGCEIKIDLIQLVKGLTKNLSDIDIYCIERIFRINKVYDSNNWNWQSEGGYYGEELGGIYLNKDIAEKLNYDIGQILGFNNENAKIEYIFKLEYLNLLPKYKNKKWKETSVVFDDIEFNNDNHLRKIAGEKYYKDYPFYHCLAQRIGNKYQIIDGYHRILENRDKKLKILYFD